MSRTLAIAGYDSEAEFYDYVWDSLKVDVEFYCRRLRGARSILDCMCGTGRVASALARAGFQVDGVDVSAEMLRRARLKARRESPLVRSRLHWQVGDLAHAELGKDHDAAIIAANSYGLILSSRNRIRALGRIHSALRPGGKLLLALDSVRSYRRIRDGIPFAAGSRRLGRRGSLYVRVMAESGSRVDRVRSTTLHLVFAKSGKLTHSQLTETITAVLSPVRVQSELRRSGFRPMKLFGDYDERSYSVKGDRFVIESVAR